MKRSFELDDAEALHRANPRTYSIPRRAVRETLPIDTCQAKLVFNFQPPAEDGCSAERMWCRVLSRQGDEYVGELVNQPRYIQDIARGAQIRFTAQHVIGVSFRDETPMEPWVGCSLGVLRAGTWPLWVVRVAPANEHDSGWRVFGGEKTDPRVRAVSANTLLRSWAVLDQVIDGDTNGAWRWNERTLEYEGVASLPPELAAAAATGLGRLHAAPPKPDMGALVTKRALEVSPLCAQRLAPSEGRADDTGWCFFVGDEPQEYLDDPNNSTIVRFARLYNLFPYLERVAGEAGERMWAWDEALGDFRELEAPNEDEE